LLTCPDGSGAFPIENKCDGVPDCKDGADEADCP